MGPFPLLLLSCFILLHPSTSLPTPPSPLPVTCLPLPKSVSHRYPPPSPVPSLRYWDNTLQRCQPCKRCKDLGMITWSPCTFFTDTHCVVEQKWSKLLQKQGGAFQYNFLGDFQEGRLVYEAEKPRVRQEKIFGQKKLWNKKTSSYKFVDNPGVKTD